MGLFLGWVYYKTESLSIAIFAHCIYNTIVTFVPHFAQIPGYYSCDGVFMKGWVYFLGVGVLVLTIKIFKKRKFEREFFADFDHFRSYSLPLTIRRATEEDLTALAELQWHFLKEKGKQLPIKKEEFVRSCSLALLEGMMMGSWTYWIATKEEEIIAQVFVQRVQNSPFPKEIVREMGLLSQLFTKKDYRRLGIATRILKRVRDWAGLEGFKSLLVAEADLEHYSYENLGYPLKIKYYDYQVFPVKKTSTFTVPTNKERETKYSLGR